MCGNTWHSMLQKNRTRLNRMTLEIRNQKLYVDDILIGNEQDIIDICEKAGNYDELKANFKGGDA